jgi:hypothetical protein
VPQAESEEHQVPQAEGEECAARGHTKRGKSDSVEAVPGLLRGLYAGDLGTLLLAVEMAADANLLPCLSPEEERRVMAFLKRLSAFDALLPRDPGRTD